MSTYYGKTKDDLAREMVALGGALALLEQCSTHGAEQCNEIDGLCAECATETRIAGDQWSAAARRWIEALRKWSAEAGQLCVFTAATAGTIKEWLEEHTIEKLLELDRLKRLLVQLVSQLDALDQPWAKMLAQLADCRTQPLHVAMIIERNQDPFKGAGYATQKSLALRIIQQFNLIDAALSELRISTIRCADRLRRFHADLHHRTLWAECAE